jgi:hypothetical protein
MMDERDNNQTQQSPRKKLSYRKPEVHVIGSLEQIQASYSGRSYDGPDGRYYYS